MAGPVLHPAPDLVAWIGEDELGSGRVGLKIGIVPAGRIPLVAVAADRLKLDRVPVVSQLQHQADRFGKTIRLARYVFAEDLVVLVPRPQG